MIEVLILLAAVAVAFQIGRKYQDWRRDCRFRMKVDRWWVR